jgi:formylglycine-generating enzyme required for sulfatase activity
MGIVYKARHAYLKTTHAIKVILPDLVGHDPMFGTRFRQEAMVAAAIRHPNIVLVTDFGIAEGEIPFLVMEFIKGRSLHQISVEHGSLSLDVSLQIMTAICAGVGAAHRQGIIHRDLKPLNVMIEDDKPALEGVKVLDFGLAKIRSGEMFGSFIQAKTTGLMGSPLYMAPEQWSDDELDNRADIYSLGVILYQMLTGDVPFKGSSLPKIMRKHLMSAPPTFAELGLHLPNQVEASVRHALEKDPKDRPASVEDFVSELREAVRSSRFDRTQQVSFTQLPTLPLPELPTGPLPATVRPETIPAQIEAPPSTRSSIQDEADRLAREFEEAQRRAEEARKRAEEAALRRAEEEAARKLAEEEASRKRAKEAELRQREEEEARRRQALEAARKLIEEEEARKRAEEEQRRRFEEEAARLRAKEDADRLAQEVQAAQLRADEARRQAEEEARKRSEEVSARVAAEEKAERLEREVMEAQRRAEEARMRAEEEARAREREEAARKKAEEEEFRRRSESEAKRLADAEAARLGAKQEADRLGREVEEAQRRAEEARQRAEEEARKRVEEEAARKRAEEEARRLLQEIEEARERLQEDVRQQAEAIARRQTEEEAAVLRAKEEAARKEIEEELERRAAVAARKQAEEEAARRLVEEEEARRRAANEAQRFAEAEAARKRAEEEAKRLAQEIEGARRLAEMAQLKAEEEARRRAEEEAQRRAREEEARLRAKEDADRLARLVEAARMRAQEARRQAEEEARRRSEEETARRLAEERAERLALEVEEAQRRAEEARKRVEDEARKQAESELSRQREEERVRDVEKEQRRKLQEQIQLLEDEKLRREREMLTAEINLQTLAEGQLDRLPSGATDRFTPGTAPSGSKTLITDQIQNVGQLTMPAGQIRIQSGKTEVPESVIVGHGPQARGRLGRILLLTVLFVAVIGVAGYGIQYLLRSGLPTKGDAEKSKPPQNDHSILILAGTFLMGRDNVPEDDAQWPAHKVSVKAFFMDRTEVTNQEYAVFVQQSGYQPPKSWISNVPPPGHELWPVTDVSLDDARAFAAWRSTRDGLKYRLPTEEEWEYAARGGSKNYLYPWGNTWCEDCANLGTGAGSKVDFPRAVGSYPNGATVWGVVDMIGNVWEWTSSEASFYPGNAKLLPQDQRGQFVMRGGSHQSLDAGAIKFRGNREFPATFRQWVPKDTRTPTLGFRLVRDAK